MEKEEADSKVGGMGKLRFENSKSGLFVLRGWVMIQGERLKPKALEKNLNKKKTKRGRRK